MTDQEQFDRLRQVCSASLDRLMLAAKETERGIQKLSLPVSPDAARQFSFHRQAELEAHEAYMMAFGNLSAFVQRHLYIVN